MSWSRHDSVWYRRGDSTSDHLAAFDIDSTLIFSDRGEKMAKSGWVWAFSNVKEKLTELRKEWTLAFISNRCGSYADILETRNRIDDILRKLGFSCWVFLATKRDEYRKPGTGMYNLLIRLTEKKYSKESFFCGDASGRSSFPHNNWADSDRRFAESCGLNYYEPEQLFAPFVAPPLSDKNKVIITTGVSGWEAYGEFKDKVVKVGDREVLFIREARPIEEKCDLVMVYGPHPTRKDRLNVITKMSLSAGEVLIYWYARPGTVNKELSNLFQSPVGEDVVRIS